MPITQITKSFETTTCKFQRPVELACDTAKSSMIEDIMKLSDEHGLPLVSVEFSVEDKHFHQVDFDDNTSVLHSVTTNGVGANHWAANGCRSALRQWWFAFSETECPFDDMFIHVLGYFKHAEDAVGHLLVCTLTDEVLPNTGKCVETFCMSDNGESYGEVASYYQMTDKVMCWNPNVSATTEDATLNTALKVIKCIFEECDTPTDVFAKLREFVWYPQYLPITKDS